MKKQDEQRVHDRIDRDAREADVADVLQGEAQAVEHDAQAQQPLLGEVDAGTRRREPRIDRVADEHAEHDGQRPLRSRPGTRWPAAGNSVGRA